MISLSKYLLLVVVVLLPQPFSPFFRGQRVNLRWSLNNEREFFHEVRLEDKAAPRRFELDVEKAKQEGVERCVTEVKAKQARSPFCEALASRLAPEFEFAFDTGKSGTLILDRIEVEVYKVYQYRGAGFVKDVANYTMSVPAQVGVTSKSPQKEFVLDRVGTIRLKLWPEFETPDSGSALDLELRFLFKSDQDNYSVSTGKFTLSL